jgi:hypothetical protein
MYSRAGSVNRVNNKQKNIGCVLINIFMTALILLIFQLHNFIVYRNLEQHGQVTQAWVINKSESDGEGSTYYLDVQYNVGLLVYKNHESVNSSTYDNARINSDIAIIYNSQDPNEIQIGSTPYQSLIPFYAMLFVISIGCMAFFSRNRFQ